MSNRATWKADSSPPSPPASRVHTSTPAAQPVGARDDAGAHLDDDDLGAAEALPQRVALKGRDVVGRERASDEDGPLNSRVPVDEFVAGERAAHVHVARIVPGLGRR